MGREERNKLFGRDEIAENRLVNFEVPLPLPPALTPFGHRAAFGTGGRLSIESTAPCVVYGPTGRAEDYGLVHPAKGI